MTKRVSARDARAHFADMTDEVRYTGEPVIVEKQGRPFVAVVSLEDLAELDKMRRGQTAVGNFARLAKEAARDYADPEPTDEEIVQSVRKIRQELYRDWYGGE